VTHLDAKNLKDLTPSRRGEYLQRQCPLADMLLFEWTTTKYHCRVVRPEAWNHIPPQTGIALLLGLGFGEACKPRLVNRFQCRMIYMEEG